MLGSTLNMLRSWGTTDGTLHQAAGCESGARTEAAVRVWICKWHILRG